MSLVRLDFTELRVGEYTPFDLFDGKGRLLAQKGILLNDAGRLTQLTRVGLFVRERDAEAWRRSLMRQVDVMAQAGASVAELAQAEPNRAARPPTAKTAAEQVRAWYLAWEDLLSGQALQVRSSLRTSADEALARWQPNMLQAARLADAQPDLAHYCLARAVLENPSTERPAEAAAAQHLLWWVSVRQLCIGLSMAESIQQWLGDAVLASLWLSVQRSLPPVNELPAGPLALLAACRLATSPLPEEALRALDTSDLAPALPDRVGLWLGAAQALHARRPSCLPQPKQWQALAQIHLGGVGLGSSPGGWQRTARAGEILLQRQWGPYPSGSFVELANGDVGLVMRPGPSADAPLLLRLRGRSGMPYIDLPFRNVDNPGHAIVAALAQADIGMRLSHEKLLLRAFAV
jgi:hypothetical protein